MTRKECLDAAAECVLQDRQKKHGRPEDCFSMIAAMWGSYLDCCISAHDVAAMMALLKIARFRHNPGHVDHAVDCAGYAACMAELATAWEREGEEEREEAVRDHEFLEHVFGAKPWAEGCEELVQDAPRTKEELYQHIVDCNPASFSRGRSLSDRHPIIEPHTPTGEELAEMAEEDDHV